MKVGNVYKLKPEYIEDLLDASIEPTPEEKKVIERRTLSRTFSVKTVVSAMSPFGTIPLTFVKKYPIFTAGIDIVGQRKCKKCKKPALYFYEKAFLCLDCYRAFFDICSVCNVEVDKGKALKYKEKTYCARCYEKIKLLKIKDSEIKAGNPKEILFAIEKFKNIPMASAILSTAKVAYQPSLSDDYRIQELTLPTFPYKVRVYGISKTRGDIFDVAVPTGAPIPFMDGVDTHSVGMDYDICVGVPYGIREEGRLEDIEEFIKYAVAKLNPPMSDSFIKKISKEIS
jgi:hypothetical protein